MRKRKNIQAKYNLVLMSVSIVNEDTIKKLSTIDERIF